MSPAMIPELITINMSANQTRRSLFMPNKGSGRRA
jgi:hypothetical protein